MLQSKRPQDLPTGLDGDSEMMEPPQASLSGVADQFFQEMPGQTGKGRGGSSTGEFALSGSAEQLGRELKTEGIMPRGEAGMKTMGRIMHPTDGVDSQKGHGDLQRALEGELVEFLRNQNSILMNELATLRDMVEKGKVSQTNSGMDSSPWSAVDGVGSTDSSVGAGVGHTQNGRLGRNGSRTPRTSKHREVAASPERKKEPQRFTPNGIRVPDGPPPSAAPVWPPVPPIPMVDDGQHVGDAELYDTCDSNPRVKNGDREWKPQSDRIDRTGVLPANEAKQFWLEQEVKSLRKALDRVAVPTAFHESGYWNGGFETKGDPETMIMQLLLLALLWNLFCIACRLVDVEMVLYCLGPCMAAVVKTLYNVGRCMAEVVQIIYCLGPCMAAVVKMLYNIGLCMELLRYQVVFGLRMCTVNTTTVIGLSSMENTNAEFGLLQSMVNTVEKLGLLQSMGDSVMTLGPLACMMMYLDKLGLLRWPKIQGGEGTI